MPRETDTVFAVASGVGRAAIAVMRISGPASGELLDALCGGRPEPRRASLRRLRDRAGEVLDQAMVLWLPGPGSYSGEDSAELHLHAGRAVVTGVADALVQLGARPAEPGEFTRRAFLNGRMDLVEAEAIGDLVAAETAEQRRQALRQLDGALGDLYRGWAVRLRLMLAEQEALIDFPDEDLPPDTEAAMLAELAALQRAIERHLDDGRRGERLREGLVFAVIGPPNVGKSTLVNALAGREVAIVSALPGTTRDALETRVELGGVPVTLVDTAGLRESGDLIEAEGVRRALARAASADLVVSVYDVSQGIDDPLNWGCTREVVVFNKADLGGCAPEGVLAVSAATGAGLDRLLASLTAEARALTDVAGPPPLTRARHRAALSEAAKRLAGARQAAWPELRAEDLRLAVRALGRVTGEVGVEDILDTIFAQFCIGK
ncbi:MAG: tRNA uridine-5-carboxymethylaminomethyl(34) synthesis GTPase MnmE [Alphaproteobacteria bacterium]|nr:tRNA uridine-5-carboxymethylaminomethyl(34) synthesis GTPase MnmE [Alphaproteobacteria bacterium]